LVWRGWDSGCCLEHVVFSDYCFGESVESAGPCIVGIPLLPGVGFVSMFFGSWQAFHQGQIALVPPVSIVVDSLIIFAIWEFVYSRRAAKADAHTTLHLNG
jgi:hypothetical protein